MLTRRTNKPHPEAQLQGSVVCGAATWARPCGAWAEGAAMIRNQGEAGTVTWSKAVPSCPHRLGIRVSPPWPDEE